MQNVLDLLSERAYYRKSRVCNGVCATGLRDAEDLRSKLIMTEVPPEIQEKMPINEMIPAFLDQLQVRTSPASFQPARRLQPLRLRAACNANAMFAEGRCSNDLMSHTEGFRSTPKTVMRRV